MSDTLLDLIARLERTDDPRGLLAKELNWSIADAVGLVPKHAVRPVGWDYDWFRNSVTEYALWKANDSEGRSMSLWEPARYTSSIDAALTLARDDVEYWILLRTALNEAKNPARFALALCTAALKARAANLRRTSAAQPTDEREEER